MLDRWIHNATKPSPQKRARQQLNALHTETLKAAQAIGKSYPNSAKSDEILSSHQHRVSRIVQQGTTPRKPRAVYPSREICHICGKPLYEAVDFWTDSLFLKLLWSLVISLVFVGLAFLAEWWALFIFPVGWLVSQSFLWTITVPLLMLLTVILILSLFGV